MAKVIRPRGLDIQSKPGGQGSEASPGAALKGTEAEAGGCSSLWAPQGTGPEPYQAGARRSHGTGARVGKQAPESPPNGTGGHQVALREARGSRTHMEAKPAVAAGPLQAEPRPPTRRGASPHRRPPAPQRRARPRLHAALPRAAGIVYAGSVARPPRLPGTPPPLPGTPAQRRTPGGLAGWLGEGPRGATEPGSGRAGGAEGAEEVGRGRGRGDLGTARARVPRWRAGRWRPGAGLGGPGACLNLGCGASWTSGREGSWGRGAARRPRYCPVDAPSGPVAACPLSLGSPLHRAAARLASSFSRVFCFRV